MSHHSSFSGAGKTWPCICLPQIIDILRDTFGYPVAMETRILYLVPLINIYHSLKSEMDRLRIPHQIVRSGSISQIDPDAKVVCMSPEKVLDQSIIREISKLSWCCISIDEPHLALIWGTSKTKHTKPFRKAFS